MPHQVASRIVRGARSQGRYEQFDRCRPVIHAARRVGLVHMDHVIPDEHSESILLTVNHHHVAHHLHRLYLEFVGLL